MAQRQVEPGAAHMSGGLQEAAHAVESFIHQLQEASPTPEDSTPSQKH